MPVRVNGVFIDNRVGEMSKLIAICEMRSIAMQFYFNILIHSIRRHVGIERLRLRSLSAPSWNMFVVGED